MSRTIYHNHHIIPIHMGGGNSPHNLIKLTIIQHAEAHKQLWFDYGNHEDWIAWKCLSGQMSNEELWYEKSKLGGYKSKGRKDSPKRIEQKRQFMLGKQIKLGKKESELTRQRKSIAFKGKLNVGKNHSEKTKQLWSLQRKGKPGKIWTKEEKLIHSKRLGKYYSFIGPDLILYAIKNLASFCREHKLCRELMVKLHSGKIQKYKGWTISDIHHVGKPEQ